MLYVVKVVFIVFLFHVFPKIAYQPFQFFQIYSISYNWNRSFTQIDIPRPIDSFYCIPWAVFSPDQSHKFLHHSYRLLGYCQASNLYEWYLQCGGNWLHIEHYTWLFYNGQDRMRLVPYLWRYSSCLCWPRSLQWICLGVITNFIDFVTDVCLTEL